VAIAAAVVVGLSIPFLITGNVMPYLKAIVFPGQEPGYQYPLVFAFSGSGALLTYLHDTFGWETVGWLQINTYVLIAAWLLPSPSPILKK